MSPNATAEPISIKKYRGLSDDELNQRIRSAKEKLGKKLLILGHHYQQDGVIEHANLRGDSLQLSEMAAAESECETIVFCGVHFMAETADILANQPHKVEQRDGRRIDVILPDMKAGCSMADMAAIRQVESCWEQLGEVVDTTKIIPVTYINSAASLKGFVGRNQGIVCTSSNAKQVLKWALDRGERVLFFPDQHLGRNTALTMGITEQQMPVWDPYAESLGGNEKSTIEQSKVLLWKGHCSVHQMFKPEHVHGFRERIEDVQILVHPECPRNVNDLADISGSTGKIIKTIESAAAGSKWAIGTELHLVNRLKKQHPDKEIHFLSPVVCMCATMYRIDLAHLCWVVENLVEGHVVNPIVVDAEVARHSISALERMLTVK